MRCSRQRTRRHQEPRRLSLVAKNRQRELISRKWYQPFKIERRVFRDEDHSLPIRLSHTPTISSSALNIVPLPLPKGGEE